ncbi:MAG: class I SAM-dependent methyltransferase [Planctomycetales bacterium]|nr:class I SAM-dependent methyltransferase [Planctomycetales bacterium]
MSKACASPVRSGYLTRQFVARHICTVAATLVLCGGSVFAQDTAVAEPKQSASPGINDRFVDPALDVSEWLERFEIESREVYAAREKVLEACEIKPGESVADVGAGTGFYSRLFASAVGPDGWVFSVDISPRFLEHITTRAREDNVHNLTAVLCSDRSVNLPPRSINAVFICDTYHHFEFPQSTLESIYKALKPGGRLIIVDFNRIPGKSREFILGHVRAGKDQFRKEVEDVGFKFVDEVEVPKFEENYLLRFRKE